MRERRPNWEVRKISRAGLPRAGAAIDCGTNDRWHWVCL